jgi:hypothetical protein
MKPSEPNRLTEPPDEEAAVTDPEDTVDMSRSEFTEDAADLLDEFDRPLPAEAEEADVIEQKLDVPDEGEDDYR